MQNTKEDAQPSHGGITLTLDDCPKIVQEKEYMQKIPYVSTVDSLMYAILYIRSSIGYIVRTVSRF